MVSNLRWRNMGDLPEQSQWTAVTQVETTDIILGGNLTTHPNLQLKQLVDRTRYLYTQVQFLLGQTANAPPTIVNALLDRTELEGSNGFAVDLNSVFDDPENVQMSFSVIANSDASKVTTSIIGNILNVGFPLWTGGFGTPTDVTIQISATDNGGGSVTDAFTITVNPLESLFTEEYFAFDYTLEAGSADIYVNGTERDAILADPTLSSLFSLQNSGAAIFRAIPSGNGGLIPATALNNGTIVPIYRFRFVGDSEFGSYLYTQSAEAQIVRGNSNFVEESSPTSPAFYALGTINRGTDLRRYRYSNRRGDGDYVYTLGNLVPGVSQVALEGTVCEVDLI